MENLKENTFVKIIYPTWTKYIYITQVSDDSIKYISLSDEIKYGSDRKTLNYEIVELTDVEIQVMIESIIKSSISIVLYFLHKYKWTFENIKAFEIMLNDLDVEYYADKKDCSTFIDSSTPIETRINYFIKVGYCKAFNYLVSLNFDFSTKIVLKQLFNDIISKTSYLLDGKHICYGKYSSIIEYNKHLSCMI